MNGDIFDILDKTMNDTDDSEDCKDTNTDPLIRRIKDCNNIVPNDISGRITYDCESSAFAILGNGDYIYCSSSGENDLVAMYHELSDKISYMLDNIGNIYSEIFDLKRRMAAIDGRLEVI